MRTASRQQLRGDRRAADAEDAMDEEDDARWRRRRGRPDDDEDDVGLTA